MRKYSNFTKVKENSVASRTNFMFKTIELIQSSKLQKNIFEWFEIGMSILKS